MVMVFVIIIVSSYVICNEIGESILRPIGYSTIISYYIALRMYSMLIPSSSTEVIQNDHKDWIFSIYLWKLYAYIAGMRFILLTILKASQRYVQLGNNTRRAALNAISRMFLFGHSCGVIDIHQHCYSFLFEYFWLE